MMAMEWHTPVMEGNLHVIDARLSQSPLRVAAPLPLQERKPFKPFLSLCHEIDQKHYAAHTYLCIIFEAIFCNKDIGINSAASVNRERCQTNVERV